MNALKCKMLGESACSQTCTHSDFIFMYAVLANVHGEPMASSTEHNVKLMCDAKCILEGGRVSEQSEFTSELFLIVAWIVLIGLRWHA